MAGYAIVFLRVPELKYSKYYMIRTLPGGISVAEALTSTHSCIVNHKPARLHILHIRSGYPIFRISGNPEVRRLLRASSEALMAYFHIVFFDIVVPTAKN